MRPRDDEAVAVTRLREAINEGVQALWMYVQRQQYRISVFTSRLPVFEPRQGLCANQPVSRVRCMIEPYLIYALLSAWGKSIGERVTSIGCPTMNSARAAGDTRLTLDRCVSGFKALCIWPMMSAIDCSKRLSRPSRWDAIGLAGAALTGARAWSLVCSLASWAALTGAGLRPCEFFRCSEANDLMDYGACLKIDGLLVPYTTLARCVRRARPASSLHRRYTLTS